MVADGRWRGRVSTVVNTAWLGERFARFVVFGLCPYRICAKASNSEHCRVTAITYSHEGVDFGGALETAGGIVRALPHLGDVFWLLAGDVFVPDFVFSQAAVERFAASGKLAHIWLVPNPEHNLKGDFGLSPDGLALNVPEGDATPKHTYSTIGLYRSALFAPPYCSIPAGNPAGVKAPLAPLLRAAMDQGLVSAERYEGAWTDVGTPARLQWLNQTSLHAIRS